MLEGIKDIAFTDLITEKFYYEENKLPDELKHKEMLTEVENDKFTINGRELPEGSREVIKTTYLDRLGQDFLDNAKGARDEINLIRKFIDKASARIAELDTPALCLPETYTKYNEYIAEQRAQGIKPKDRMTGVEFVKKHWQKYIDAGLLFLPQLRKLDPSLVSRLYYDAEKAKVNISEFVPDVSDRAKKEIENFDKTLLKSDKALIKKLNRVRSNAHNHGISLSSTEPVNH